MKTVLVNVCGVREENFVDGKCYACGHSVCDMSPERLYDERIWQYASKVTGIPGGMFNPYNFIAALKEKGRVEKAPKYIKDFVAKYE